jgi:streptogramin lyase
MRPHRLAPLVTALAVSVMVAPGSGALTNAGLVVPNTSTAGVGAQFAAPPSVVRALATPGSPGDDPAGALAALGSPNSPQDDLEDALDALASAPDSGAAAAARQLALDVLEGNPLAGRVYSGIPLLNWNVPARVKTVPAGGVVTVTEVRFATRAISDTALLQFADPDQPFTINYRVAELGSSFGGVFSPAPLLADAATPIGGLASVVQPLAVPNQPTGTTDTNRFHPTGAAEATRTVVQQLSVRMPPPRLLTAILDPDVRPGHPTITTLAPATPDRLAALEASYGFVGGTPTDGEKAAAIARLSPATPAKVLWSGLQQLDPAAPDFVTAAHAAGTQLAPLVDALTVHTALPGGVPTNAAADLGVALAGGEAFVSRDTVAGRGSMTVAVTNADGFAHTFAVRVLHSRTPVHGPMDWGEFAWTTAATATLAPGEQRTLTIAAARNPFALWVGDPDGGDQAGMVVTVDSGPARSSVTFASNIASPEHMAQDASGHVWVALAGTDTIARVTPAGSIASATVEEFPLPNGNHTITSTAFPLAPHDLVIDSHGIVWATLAEGNAIARLDPAAAHAGTSDGIRVYPLPPCVVPAPACAVPIPAPPGEPPVSRDPNQMKALTAANGDTILWFTESNADAVGMLRVAPDGTLVTQADLPCGCNEPLGVALGADGAVWFSVLAGNELVRITTTPNRPSDATAATFDRFPIPSGVQVIDPVHPEPGIRTAGAHSLAIDAAGRVWVTEEETAKIGFLDPATAHPGSTAGFTEFPLGVTDFGAAIQPADLTIDGAGTVFWVDEYGDAVGSVTASGTVTKWRPAERVSMTDSPMIDSQGNFWFAEPGANLVTRLSGVGTAPAPIAPPPTITADLAAASVSGSGVLATTTVDVDVVRAGTTIAHAGAVPVTAGAFTAAVAGLAAGDTVRVTRHGGPLRPVLAFTVASISVAVTADGALSGTVTASGQPLGDSVTVVHGNGPVTEPLSPAGTFTATVPSGTNGSVAWSGATVAGIFRTVTAFTVAAAVQPPVITPANRPPAGDLPIGALHPGAPDGGAVAPAPLSPLARACTEKLWLVAKSVPLLGLSTDQLRACLGSPVRIRTRRGTQTWSYASGIAVRVRRGTVDSFIVSNATFGTDAGHVGVGSPLWQLSLALSKVRFDPARRAFRALVPLGHRAYADVRIPASRSRNPRVRPFTVTRVTARSLDRFARTHLR